MTTTADHEPHTLLPPEPGTENEQLLQAVGALLARHRAPSGHARLVGPDGDQIELPDDLYAVVRVAVEALLAGQGVSIAPHTAKLSTQEAADLLGISRPTLVKLLEAGEIPFEQAGHGRHRRIRLADLEEYRRATRHARRAALTELTRAADEDGLYETGTGFVETR